MLQSKTLILLVLATIIAIFPNGTGSQNTDTNSINIANNIIIKQKLLNIKADSLEKVFNQKYDTAKKMSETISDNSVIDYNNINYIKDMINNLIKKSRVVIIRENPKIIKDTIFIKKLIYPDSLQDNQYDSIYNKYSSDTIIHKNKNFFNTLWYNLFKHKKDE